MNSRFKENFSNLLKYHLSACYYWIDELASDKDSERVTCINAPARHSTNTWLIDVWKSYTRNIILIFHFCNQCLWSWNCHFWHGCNWFWLLMFGWLMGESLWNTYGMFPKFGAEKTNLPFSMDEEASAVHASFTSAWNPIMKNAPCAFCKCFYPEIFGVS